MGFELAVGARIERSARVHEELRIASRIVGDVEGGAFECVLDQGVGLRSCRVQ